MCVWYVWGRGRAGGRGNKALSVGLAAWLCFVPPDVVGPNWCTMAVIMIVPPPPPPSPPAEEYEHRRHSSFHSNTGASGIGGAGAGASGCSVAEAKFGAEGSRSSGVDEGSGHMSDPHGAATNMPSEAEVRSDWGAQDDDEDDDTFGKKGWTGKGGLDFSGRDGPTQRDCDHEVGGGG